jgi:S-adenosylmethionine synthetase
VPRARVLREPDRQLRHRRPGRRRGAHRPQDHRRHLRRRGPHGGGAFSGKDPTKVDRSAAYAARYLAKNVVAAGLAERCVIQVSYAIGVSKPLSIYVDTQGTGEVDEERLGRVLGEVMDLSPRGIRETLKLNRPVYARTSAYGHFGREPEDDGGFSWERRDLVDELRRAFN